MKATAKDLRFKTKWLLESVQRGEEVTITLRGKPCAKLIPLADGEPTQMDSSIFGLWKDRDMNIDEHIRQLRKGRFE